MWSRYRVLIAVTLVTSSPYPSFLSLIDSHFDTSTISNTANMPDDDLASHCDTLRKLDRKSKFGEEIDDMSRLVSRFDGLVSAAKTVDELDKQPGRYKFDDSELSRQFAKSIIEVGHLAKLTIYSLAAQPTFDECSEIFNRYAAKIVEK